MSAPSGGGPCGRAATGMNREDGEKPLGGGGIVEDEGAFVNFDGIALRSEAHRVFGFELGGQVGQRLAGAGRLSRPQRGE